MSFFKRAMATMGIGSAKIDTVLEGDRFRAGEEIIGKIYVKGGNVDQDINKITIRLMTYYLTEEIERHVDDNNNEVEEFTTRKNDFQMDAIEFPKPFTIQAKQTVEFDFSFKIPDAAPITGDNEAVWIQTDLDIAAGVDSSDRDYIQLLPHPYIQYVYDILTSNLGFELVGFEQKYTNFNGRSLPIIQEIRFIPNSFLHGQLDDIEIIFNVTSYGLEMFIEIDRKLRGVRGIILESLDLDESVIRIKIDAQRFQNDNGQIEEEICNVLAHYAQA